MRVDSSLYKCLRINYKKASTNLDRLAWGNRHALVKVNICDVGNRCDGSTQLIGSLFRIKPTHEKIGDPRGVINEWILKDLGWRRTIIEI